MWEQDTSLSEQVIGKKPGSYCDFALFEADGTCRIVAAHSGRLKLQPGQEFFSAVGMSGSESQFVMHTLLDQKGHFALARSDAGPVLFSDYFYLSVRLICATIPHVKVDSVARVSHNCFPEIALSPSLKAQNLNPVPGDESTYTVLQHIRNCYMDAFPRCETEICDEQEVIRSTYRSAQMLSELVGNRFHMACPETERGVQIKYDPTIGVLCILIYFCYVERVAQSSDILLSVLPADGTARMELCRSIPNVEKYIPEMIALRDLERYSRQLVDFVKVGENVTLRLFMAPSEDPNLLGLKCCTPGEKRPQPVLSFHFSIYKQ